MEKLTLEEFEQVKILMIQLKDKVLQLEESGSDTSINYDEFKESYLEIQKTLTTHDLSDIPFEAWEGIPLLDEEADFSKTKANIDFNLISECYRNGNFKGCNVRGLDKIKHLNPDGFDDETIKNNPDLFLSDIFSKEFMEKYYSGSLSPNDIVTLSFTQIEELAEKNVFTHIKLEYKDTIKNLVNDVGDKNFIPLFKKHPDVIMQIISTKNVPYYFSEVKDSKDVERSFRWAVKNHIASNCENQIVRYTPSGIIYENPKWLTTMHFTFIDTIDSIEELEKSDEDVAVIDLVQRMLIEELNIENIKRFEKETKFFSYKNSRDSRGLSMFQMLSGYLQNYGNPYFYHDLSYNEFVNAIVSCLDEMRKDESFTVDVNYDFIQGKFREEHPEIFIDINAPKELRDAFYTGRITPDFLRKNKGYIPYLIDKNLENTIRTFIKITLPDEITSDGYISTETKDFIKEYASRYGNEKCLNLVSKYGNIINDIRVESLNNEIEDEQNLEKKLREAIYQRILKDMYCDDYIHLENIDEFIREYPDIFLNLDDIPTFLEFEKERLTTAFYDRTLEYDDIRKHPELIDVLKNKNLYLAFGKTLNRIKYASKNYYGDLELLDVLGNEEFLKLCSKYGRYMDSISNYLITSGRIFDPNNKLTIDEVSEKIENTIFKRCLAGDVYYYPDDAPTFLKEEHPELFLSEDAPKELKKYFYNYNFAYPMDFQVLAQNKDWLPYLEGKSIYSAIMKKQPYDKEAYKNYFSTFGIDDGIKLGIKRAETVTEMINSRKISLMKSWYDKTGKKFIPDVVVMNAFPLKEADKFLESASNWSTLMKIKDFAKSLEARDAMLKLAYSFGAFDDDQVGIKKLITLLTDLPRTINIYPNRIIGLIDEEINLASRKNYFYKLAYPHLSDEEAYKESFKYLQEHDFTGFIDQDIKINLFKALKDENVNVDFSKDIFRQIYRENEDGSATLTISPQSCPKSCQIIRSILSTFSDFPMITPNKAHQLFSGFSLKYSPDFREFLLENMNLILTNPEYASYISNIERQFDDIKAINSNRFLTIDLAVSYVQSNKYASVNVGNERVAEVSAIAGYNQNDFNALQQIYNYGKQRTFSSIPRIEGKTDKYTYEILRLDNPLAMAIGTLTNCCQKLGDLAESCMRHSMTDKNGRVFVIKDKDGNIVSQSWVWRNKDVLCFDNIEIPNKAFTRAEREDLNLGRNGFTDEVYDIYKMAASELIEVDEKSYKELLEQGKITKEQYDGLRLGKVTVGLGFNDIASSVKRHCTVDKEKVARPLPFIDPISHTSDLYTSDSSTQYVLEERVDREEYEGETLSLHNDSYTLCTDDNFTEKDLLSLEKLELVTKKNFYPVNSPIKQSSGKNHLVSELAINYGLNPDTTKVILSPNFAIIYDETEEKVRIGDLLYNTNVDNELQQMNIEDTVTMQIGLALKQIGKGKIFDTSDLVGEQKEIYKNAICLKEEEFDIERGVHRAR